MLERIRTITQEEEPLRFIIVTGDIAFRGKPREYDRAEDFLRRLLDITDLLPNRLFLVPGNHDVYRDYSCVQRHIEELRQLGDQDISLEYVYDKLADDEVFLAALMGKFSHFNDFSERMLGRRICDNKHHYCFAEFLDLDGNLRIGLLGLNSSLFAGYKEDDKRRLALGLMQVESALEQLKKHDPEHRSSRIGFFHHPFDCFHKEDKSCERTLRWECDVILMGHKHESDADEPKSGAIPIFAGATFEELKYPNSFNMVTIEPETGKGTVTPFEYRDKENRWIQDTLTYSDWNQKVFPFNIKPPGTGNRPYLRTREKPGLSMSIGSSEHGKPTVPLARRDIFIRAPAPLDNSIFTHRDGELDRLKDVANDEPDPVTGKQGVIITALWARIPGIGTTSLARKLVEELVDSDFSRRIIWYSFELSANKEPTHLFHELLSHPNLSIRDSSPTEINLPDLLYHRLEEQPTYLVLDGIEAIQNTNPSAHGVIEDRYRDIKEFLEKILNHRSIRVLVTSTVEITDFNEKTAGYLPVFLDTFDEDTGAALLLAHGVTESKTPLKNCSRLLGGHALILSVVGKLLKARSRSSADHIEELVGNKAEFKNQNELGKVAQLVKNHLRDLNPNQKDFLRRLGSYYGPISRKELGWLMDDRQRKDKGHLSWTEEDKIILPLKKKGLIEANGKDDYTEYDIHPFMRLALAECFEGNRQRQTHRILATKILSKSQLPDSASQLNTLDELQPFLDAASHFSEAGQWLRAWEIYRDRRVDRRLFELGYAKELYNCLTRFEESCEKDDWKPNQQNLAHLHGCLVAVCHVLGRNPEKWEEMESYRSIIGSPVPAAYAGHALGLANAYLESGDMDTGRQLMGRQNLPMEKITRTPAEFALLQAVEAKAELFSGRYDDAIDRFSNIEKGLDTFQKLVFGCYLAEAYWRRGEFKPAEKRLKEIMDEAEKRAYRVLLPDIFQRLTWLALDRDNHSIEEAGEWENGRKNTCQKTDIPYVPDAFFLLSINQSSRAQQWAIDVRKTSSHHRNFDMEIRALLVIADAWRREGNNEHARRYLEDARILMGKTNCRRERNRLGKMEQLLKS